VSELLGYVQIFETVKEIKENLQCSYIHKQTWNSLISHQQMFKCM